MVSGGYYQSGNYAIFANLSNSGNVDKNVEVSLSIISETFSLVFSDSVTITIPAGGHTYANFAAWSASDGNYFLNVSVPNDLILTNNYINYSFTIYTPIYDNDLRISARPNATQPAVQTNITVEITNLGNLPASNFKVNLTSYISDSPVLLEDSGIPGAVSWSFEDLTNRTSNWKKWTSPVHSGTYSYASKLSTTSYGNNNDDSFISPEIDLAGTTSPKLTFWHTYSTENGHDGGYIQVKDALGEWVQITPIGGYNSVSGTTNHYTPDNTPVFGGDSGGWVQAEFPLSAYIGLKISFRFVFTSDDAGVSGYSGWFIDDINVSDGENVIFFDDAEGTMKFTPCYLPTGNFWHIEQNSYTSSPAWVCSDSTGNYRNLTEQSLLSPPLNLSNFIYAELSFDHRCDVLSGDHGSVQVSSNGGTTWTEILNVTDVLSWTHVSLNLLPYISSNVRIRFKFHSSTSGSTYGWLIDNIRVNGTRFVTISSESKTSPGPLNPSEITTINFTFVPPFEDTIQFTAQVILPGDSNSQNDFANFSIKFINIMDFAVTRLSLNTPTYPCVLIIDFGLGSTPNSGYEEVKSSIENAGLQCDVWNVSEYGVPTSHLLDTYSIVVFSVNKPLDSQNASIARNLKTYLSHGGRAVIYGAASAYYLSLADMELMRNYFKVEHVSNLSNSAILSVKDTIGEISVPAFLVENSSTLSILSPQGICCFRHANLNFANAAGVQIEGESYRCVIFSFEISKLASGIRNEILSNTISFLGITNVRYPAGFNLNINATIKNLGNVFGSSQVELIVENMLGLEVYSDSTYISLLPSESGIVHFTWTVAAGSYVVRVISQSTEHGGNTLNNELSAKILGGEIQDLAVSSMYAVPSGLDTGLGSSASYFIYASITNVGTEQVDSSSLYCKIVNSTGVEFFENSQNIGSLSPRTTAKVLFEEWHPITAGLLYANVNITSSSDQNEANNFAGISILIPPLREVNIECAQPTNITHKGGSAIFQLKLENKGNVFDRYSISITGNSSFTVSSDKNNIGLDFGAFDFVNITISVPVSIEAREYSFKVDVRSLDDITYVNTTYLLVIIEHDFSPEISGYVTPQSGDIETEFEFVCEYKDFENSPPEYVWVIIDDAKRDMHPKDETDLTYSDGKTYFLKTNLSSGIHNYKFEVSDGINVNSTSTSTIRVTKDILVTLDWLTINGIGCGNGTILLESITDAGDAPIDYVSLGLIALIFQSNIVWDEVKITVDYSLVNLNTINESTITLFYYLTDWTPLSGTLDTTKHIYTYMGSSLPNCRYLGLYAKSDSNIQPIADAGPSIIKGLGEPVTFDASSSWDEHIDTLQYFWDFGDGSNASGKIVTHTYLSLGTYYVTLKVIDDGGRVSVDVITVVIIAYNKPPVAEAGKNFTVKIREVAKFDASRSVDPEGDFLNYTWDFGDKSIGYGIMPTHVYNSVGKFRVRLFVTDGQNNATDYLTVTVNKEENRVSDILFLIGAILGLICILAVSVIIGRMILKSKSNKEETPEFYQGKPQVQITQGNNQIAQEYEPKPPGHDQMQQAQHAPGGSPGPVEYSSPKKDTAEFEKEGVKAPSYTKSESVKEYSAENVDTGDTGLGKEKASRLEKEVPSYNSEPTLKENDKKDDVQK